MDGEDEIRRTLHQLLFEQCLPNLSFALAIKTSCKTSISVQVPFGSRSIKPSACSGNLAGTLHEGDSLYLVSMVATGEAVFGNISMWYVCLLECGPLLKGQHSVCPVLACFCLSFFSSLIHTHAHTHTHAHILTCTHYFKGNFSLWGRCYSLCNEEEAVPEWSGGYSALHV